MMGSNTSEKQIAKKYAALLGQRWSKLSVNWQKTFKGDRKKAIAARNQMFEDTITEAINEAKDV